MTLAELVAAVVLKATGKVSSLTNADTKWNKIKQIANYYINSWQEEPGVDWSSLYDPEHAIATVTNTDTFALPSTVRKLSDTVGDVVRIHHADGVTSTDFAIVEADKLKGYYDGPNKESPLGNVCAQVGANLVFNRVFDSSHPAFGGSIKAPVYTFATELDADSDVVPVDIPNWLVLVTAAEYVRNDITRQNQYPNLINEANSLMQRMKENNEAQVSEVIRPYSVLGQTWA